MSEPILTIDGLETCYGLSQVLFGVSFSIAPGEMVTLMGRNGMGKTTTVRSIMGLTPARAGRVRFAGAEIRGLPAYRIAQAGVGLVPEGRQIFPNLTVRENLVATAAGHGRVDARRASTSCSRGWPSARPAWAINCPAASSRCSPSAAR